MQKTMFSKTKIFLKDKTLILVIIVLTVACTFFNSSFLTAFNISGVLTETAFMAFLAMGMTLVMLTGGIDLSVGALAGLSTVIIALVMDELYVVNDFVTIIVAVVLAVAACSLLGLVNGLCVTKLKLPPLIVTLGMTWIANGIGNSLLKGTPLALSVDAYKDIFRYRLFSWIPITFILVLLILFGMYYLLTRCRWGREFYSVGSNRFAAHISGIKTNSVLRRAYIFSGLFSAVAGILVAAYTGSGYPDAAHNYEIYTIAAVVMGGVSMNGGKGKIQQTFIGVIVLRLLNKLVVFSGLSSISGFIEGIIVGALLIAVLLIGNIQKRGEI